MTSASVVGRPFDDGVQMGPVIDAANCERILGVIDRPVRAAPASC